MANILTYTMTIPNAGETLRVRPNIYINKELMDGVTAGTIPTSGSGLTWSQLLSTLKDSTGVIANKFYVKTWGGSDVSNPSVFEDLFTNGMTFPAVPSGFYDVDLTENKYNTFHFNCSRYAGFTAWNSTTSSFSRQQNPFYAYVSPSTTQRVINLGVTDTNIVSQMLLSYSGLTITYSITNQTWSYNISVPRDITNEVPQTVLNFFGTSPTPDPGPDDPYGGGGHSETGGGDPQKQNWDENSDYVKEDIMPDEEYYGAVSSGLVTIFHPSKEQVKRLADVLWADDFFNFVQNAIQNIGDLFISFGMVPFYITGGDNVEVTWFNYQITGAASKTDVYLRLCEKQFMEFDMGSIAINGSDSRIFATDSALDYSPYSKLGIYLPFIGYQEMDIDECRGQFVHLKYRVDLLSGTCVALISLRELSDDPETSRTIYQFSGNCLTQIPLTSVDCQTMITNSVNLAVSLASAGATAAIASAGDAVTAELASTEKRPISANQANLQYAQHAASVSNANGSLAATTANAIMGMKPNFKKAGALGASASLFSVKQPYLFLTTPRQSMPEGYGKVCGFPCNIYGELGSFSGYTVVEDIRLNGLVATSPEVEEIYTLLKKGVII